MSVDLPEDEKPFEDLNIYVLCQSCGRKFSEDVLKRHFPVCKKFKIRKRKVFISGEQRARGSDIPIDKILRPGEIPQTNLQVSLLGKKNWRRKHQDLLNIIKSANGYKSGTQSNLLEPVEKELPPDYITCEFCKRNFQEYVAQRHIPFCKDIHLRMKYKDMLKHPKMTLKHGSTNQETLEYKYQKYKNKSIYSTDSNTKIEPKNGINNSSLALNATSLIILRTGRSQTNYINAKKDVSCYPFTSISPGSDIEWQQLPPLRDNGCNRPLDFERNSARTPSLLKRSPIFTKNSSDSFEKFQIIPPRIPLTSVPFTTARFCFHCGSEYVPAVAKYCYNCGTYRLTVCKLL